MLPARPRPKGLPSGPASTRDQPSNGSGPSSRHFRAQRSLALAPSQDLSTWKDSSSEFRRANSTRDVRNPRQWSGYSNASEPSPASSFLDRMKGDSVGYESSRSTLEKDSESPIRRRPEAKSLRRRGVSESQRSNEDELDAKRTEGEGHSLWNQVVTVASGLTVNVSKAWASNLPTFNGEETPPGQDSRLTRAMKAYHLDKARDPSDLPAWLFEEHERMPGGRSRFRDGHRGSDTGYENGDRLQSPPRSRSLRDVRDTSSANSASLRAERAPVFDRFDAGAAPAKATNRLKELRDAKRNARMAPTNSQGSDPRLGDSRRLGARAAEDADRLTALQTGLPSGPNMSGLGSRRF